MAIRQKYIDYNNSPIDLMDWQCFGVHNFFDPWETTTDTFLFAVQSS